VALEENTRQHIPQLENSN